MTNDLESRILQHYAERGKSRSFAGRYHCYFLVYDEKHDDVEYAIVREKEIKGWRREKKERLISSFNPTWRFLNGDIMEWPPEESVGLEHDGY